jgi:twitching motility protein PilT
MRLEDLLKMAITSGASDLHLKAGNYPTLRINGELQRQEQLPLLTSQNTAGIMDELTNEQMRAQFREKRELDFAHDSVKLGRFRVNACFQRGGISLAFRPIRTSSPSLEELGLPVKVCQEMVTRRSGLVLVTGPAGCGKSTTLSAMLHYLNATQPRRVVTIEDPVELIHEDNLCFFTQREVGVDTLTFAEGLRHSLRQDPDVIMVGEMRDLETMSTALTAAETGHLVLATLHTPGAAKAVDRFIDVFPAHQQTQVRVQLANTLEGVFYQALVRRADGRGRIPAAEVMTATPAIRNLIREGKTHQLPSAIQTGHLYGMQTLDQALATLARQGTITLQEALARAVNPEELKSALNGMAQGSHGPAGV